jgi:hypothetical protein
MTISPVPIRTTLSEMAGYDGTDAPSSYPKIWNTLSPPENLFFRIKGQDISEPTQHAPGSAHRQQASALEWVAPA